MGTRRSLDDYPQVMDTDGSGPNIHGMITHGCWTTSEMPGRPGGLSSG
jgi:hypothetical protein